MTRFIDFMKKYFAELLCIICMIAIMLFMMTPYIEVIAKETSYVDGVKVKTVVDTVSFGFYSILGKNPLVINGESFVLNNTFVVFLIAYIFLILSAIGVVFAIIMREKYFNTVARVLYYFSLVSAFVSIFGILVFGYCFLGVDKVVSANPNVKLDSCVSNVFGISIIILTLTYVLILFTKLFRVNKYTTQEIAETAVLIGLAIVLDKFARIPVFPASGGSINLSAIPLLIIGYRYGPFKCLVASCVLFGFISCLIDGYGLQTYPFDYFVAFSGYASIGVAALFVNKTVDKSNKKKYFVSMLLATLIAYIPATIMRYIGAMIDGFLLYGPITFVENFVYQSSYIPLSTGVSFIGFAILLEPLILIEIVFPPKIANN